MLFRMKTPCLFPKKIIAGDHITWHQPCPIDNQGNSSLGMELVLSTAGGTHLLKGEKQQGGFLFTLSGDISDQLLPGSCCWQLYFYEDGNRTTLDSGTLEVLANLAAHPSGYDNRSWLEKAVEALQAAIAGRASSAQLEWELDVGDVLAYLDKAEKEAKTVRQVLHIIREKGCVPEDCDLPAPHPLDRYMGSFMPFELVLKTVPDLERGELLQGVTASELNVLYEAVEETNPFFSKWQKNSKWRDRRGYRQQACRGSPFSCGERA